MFDAFGCQEQSLSVSIGVIGNARIKASISFLTGSRGMVPILTMTNTSRQAWKDVIDILQKKLARVIALEINLPILRFYSRFLVAQANG